jgi:peptidoglycan/LPS O-acetylase OafA/YrhL
MGVHFHFHPPAGHPFYYVDVFLRRVGLVGVDLFFVLSGFLIGSLLLTELKKYSKVDILRFIIRRGFKLYPVYYVFVGYSMLRIVMKSHGSGVSLVDSTVGAIREFSTSILFLQNYIPPNPARHTWSLAVEEHFYLVLPFVLAFLGARRAWKWVIRISLATIPVCLVLRIISVLGQMSHQTMVLGTDLDLGATHYHIDGLMLGVGLAAIAVNSPEQFIRLARFPRALIGLGLVCWLVALLPERWVFFWTTFGFSLRVLGSAAILVGACSLPAKSTTQRGLLAWVGASSYAIYVWHPTIMGITEKLTSGFLGTHVTDQVWFWLITSVIEVSTCVVFGALVTRFIERPSLALRDRWFPSRGRAVVLPQAAALPQEPPASPGSETECGGPELHSKASPQKSASAL